MNAGTAYTVELIRKGLTLLQMIEDHPSGSIPGKFSLNDPATDWTDAIGDSGKVLNQGKLTIEYSCTVRKTCNCCKKTGVLYVSSN